MSKIIVIGAGFSGLSAAAYLAAAGHEVHVHEKNDSPGGRARQLVTENGYVFDMGPSWYWMPDVFERFFGDFGHSVSDFYNLTLLDPSFDVVYSQDDVLSIPANFLELAALFESIENGSSVNLEKFMDEAKYKYHAGMNNMAYLPGLSITEWADYNIMKGLLKLQVFSSFSKHVRKYFAHPKLIALMEFPVLFLGGTPKEIPALYSLLNYAGFKLGTWYPQGGFGQLIQAIVKIAKARGARMHYNSEITRIIVHKNQVCGIVSNEREFECDAIVAAADYHHVESKLLGFDHRNYSDQYWTKKILAPSCLIYFVGITKKLRLSHHTLFFDGDLVQHSNEIYKDPQWPTKPQFYVCCPSRSDPSVAPAGHENLFLLMPLAAGLEDNEEQREKYFEIMLSRLEKHVSENLKESIDYKESYCVNDFIDDYHAYKGNAYGLANTLWQTAILKPKIRNKKISNLFYAGQLTVPGPGVPPSLISGKIAAEQLLKELKREKREVFV